MTWTDGPPPEAGGLYLVVLCPRALERRYARVLPRYESKPVAVEWLGDRGWDTLRRTRVDGDTVVRHAKLEG